jgi:hypothetical protein
LPASGFKLFPAAPVAAEFPAPERKTDALNVAGRSAELSSFFQKTKVISSPMFVALGSGNRAAPRTFGIDHFGLGP